MSDIPKSVSINEEGRSEPLQIEPGTIHPLPGSVKLGGNLDMLRAAVH